MAANYQSNGTLIQSATFKYDVFGNRVEEDDYNASTQVTTVTKFAYDAAGNIWADLNSSNQLMDRRLFVDVNGQTQPFARIDSSGRVSWYLTDHLGSVRLITDNSAVVIDQIDYDAWGNITNETNKANGDRYKYASGQYDAVLGMTLYAHNSTGRWYMASNGNWLNADPTGLAAGPNPYDYVGNNPTNATDPSGLIEGAAPAIRNDQLEYWSKAGWIDWEHARPDGAKALLKAIADARTSGPTKQATQVVERYSLALGGGVALSVPERFRKGKGYIKVVFQTPAQDWKEKLGYPNVTYLIHIPDERLTDTEWNGIALGIYEDYTAVFETWQEFAGQIKPGAKSMSGWSQEDPFSNLVGFYMAVNKIDQKQLLEKGYLGERLGKDEALKLMESLKGNLGWPSNKHREFTPVNHNSQTQTFKDVKMEVDRFFSSITDPSSGPGAKYWMRLDWDAEHDLFVDLVKRADKATENLKGPEPK